MERPKFPVEIFEIAPGDALKRDEFSIVVGEARHKGRCLSFALVESDRLGRFDPDRARELGIPEGPRWGAIHRGETVTLEDGRQVTPAELVGPPRPGRRIAISGDSAPCDSVRELARGADLLVHEATFGDDERERARETRHATARAAATFARDAGARRLVISHISARYSRESPELVAEAREVFPETVVAKDGMVVEVPFRDADG
jgi:ribonuclease Z